MRKSRPPKRLIMTLDSAKIPKQKEIIENLENVPRSQFRKEFTEAIVLEKIKNSGKNIRAFSIPYTTQEESNIPFAVHDGENFYFLKIESEKLDSHKSEIRKHYGEINTDIKKAKKIMKVKVNNLIYATPFLINGKKIRDQLYRNLPVEFLNIRVDSNSLERKIKEHQSVSDSNSPEDMELVQYCSYKGHPQFLNKEDTKYKKNCSSCKHNIYLYELK